MKLIIIFGPPAVGKMTVGKELAKLTGLKLFHNHISIETVLPFFDFDTPGFKKLNSTIRRTLFQEMAKSKQKGLIFTFVWAFNLKEEAIYINSIVRIFKKEKSKVYFVELEADLKERLKRNKHSKRLQEKARKRDTNKSEESLLQTEKNYRLNSKPGEIKRKNYLRINNTKLSAKKTAETIKECFKL
jgi:hypothetical protein